MDRNIKAQKQAKRQQEDAALNRILIWFCAAVVVEFVLLLIGRSVPDVAAIHWASVLVPVIAVLAMIFYLFQRDFFCIALISAGGIFSMYLYRKIFLYHPTMTRCGFALAFVLLAVAAAVLILLQRHRRPLPLRADKLVPADANFPLLYITCALNALALALTLALGSSAAYYLIIVLVGWLFATVVYYIVKLM